MSKPETMAAVELRAEIEAPAEAEAAHLDEAKAKARAALAEIEKRNGKRRDDHEVARLAALEADAPVPPVPDMEDGREYRDLLRRLIWRKSENLHHRELLLAAGLSEIEQAWQEARSALDAEAREIAALAEAWASKQGAWWRLVRDARQAAEATPNGRQLGGPSTRMRPRPTAGDVLVAATGVDICGVTDHRLPPTAIRHDDGEVELIETTLLRLQG